MGLCVIGNQTGSLTVSWALKPWWRHAWIVITTTVPRATAAMQQCPPFCDVTTINQTVCHINVLTFPFDKPIRPSWVMLQTWDVGFISTWNSLNINCKGGHRVVPNRLRQKCYVRTCMLKLIYHNICTYRCVGWHLCGLWFTNSA